MLIEEIIQGILEGMHEDWRKSVDGGMDPMIPFVKINREIVPYGRDPMTQFVQTEEISRNGDKFGWCNNGSYSIN